MKTPKAIELAFATLAAFAPLSGCATLTNTPNATVRVRVVDEEGKPISGVHANVYNIFDMDTRPGLTDTNGIHSVHLYNIFEISGSFKKQGYYTSYGVFWEASEWSKVPSANTNFTVVLKRIIEPIQMRKREVRAIFPRLKEPVGFDLEIGDWVFPDGKGKIADIRLTGNGHYVSVNDYSFEVVVEFSGKFDGIQSFHVPKGGAGALLKSELPPPPIAPESGYEKTFERSIRRLPSDKWFPASSDETRRWIYRIRTEVDEERKIISANYGWMTKDFSFGNPNGIGVIVFNYYYNPDPKSRSLEPKEIADRQAKDIPKEGGK